MNRICRDCNLNLHISEYGINNANKDKLHTRCKKCVSIRSSEYYIKNRDEIDKKRKDYKKQWHKDNYERLYKEQRERILNRHEEYKAYLKDYGKKNKIKLREQAKKRIKENPLVKLSVVLRSRLNKALKSKRWYKTKGFNEYIGCSRDQLKVHLETQFTKGMTWENHGKWHIDHIIPLCSAKTEEDIYKLCHYTNLQPLWAIDNFKKNKK